VVAIPAGETLLQTAAGSALGTMVIRLAKLHGFKTINVVRRREQVEELKRLGADHVIVESDGPLAEQVKAITGGGVKYALDPVGGATGTQAAACLSSGGTLLLYGSLSNQPLSIDNRHMLTGSKTVKGFWLADYVKTQRIPQMLRLIREVRQLVRDGVTTTMQSQSFALSAVRDAVAAAETPGKAAKVLLRIGS
jgi:NADPH:quinone reductase